MFDYSISSTEEQRRASEGILRGSGLRKTVGRVKIIQALMGAGRPLTAGELLGALGGDAMDVASIYRVLQVFSERAIVHKIEGADKISRFALNRGGPRHPHFSCRSCGRMDCMDEVDVTHLDICTKGYVVEEESLLFLGLCAHCNKAV